MDTRIDCVVVFDDSITKWGEIEIGDMVEVKKEQRNKMYCYFNGSKIGEAFNYNKNDRKIKPGKYYIWYRRGLTKPISIYAKGFFGKKKVKIRRFLTWVTSA